MDIPDSKITAGDAVSGGDEGDARGGPSWVHNQTCTFPVCCGSFGAHYILGIHSYCVVNMSSCKQFWTIFHYKLLFYKFVVGAMPPFIGLK